MQSQKENNCWNRQNKYNLQEIIETMTLEIITPEKMVFSGEVRSVTLPGTLGLFEVLENHAPIISSLKAGTLKFVQPDGNEIAVEICSGFAEVSNNVINVCVEGTKQ
jgi:F-type H+-transporting ATPase subunit epsilon